MAARENPDTAPPVNSSATVAEPRPESLAFPPPASPAPPAAPAAPVLLENPNPPAPAPSEGTADVVTLEASAPSENAQPVAEAAPALDQPLRMLPRRPRLRATFHYDARDELSVELTLMDDRRELIYRMTMTAAPGGAIARICEALLGVVTSAAAAAGVFGSRER